MSDTGGANISTLDSIKGFLRSSAPAIAGGGACFLNYRSMRTIVMGRMVGGPALIFAATYGVLNYQLYGLAKKQVKFNATEAYKISRM